MHFDQRQQRLHELAEQIRRHQLASAAQLALDTLAPVAVLTSQVALFVRPFVPNGRWADYLSALDDASGWETLRSLIVEQDR